VRTEDVRPVSERRLVRHGPLGQLTDADLDRVRRFIRLMFDDEPGHLR